MKNPSTGRDAQRATFVESLYNSLRKKTATAIDYHNKMVVLADTYIKDGLEDSECVELLMIDGGISREAAEAYIGMVKNSGVDDDFDGDGGEYSFQFEDSYGKVWSSYDIGKTVRASSRSEALEKAEELLMAESSIELEKVIQVDRIL